MRKAASASCIGSARARSARTEWRSFWIGERQGIQRRSRLGVPSKMNVVGWVLLLASSLVLGYISLVMAIGGLITGTIGVHTEHPPVSFKEKPLSFLTCWGIWV